MMQKLDSLYNLGKLTAFIEMPPLPWWRGGLDETTIRQYQVSKVVPKV